jgi:hypothetical protein
MTARVFSVYGLFQPFRIQGVPNRVDVHIEDRHPSRHFDGGDGGPPPCGRPCIVDLVASLESAGGQGQVRASVPLPTPIPKDAPTKAANSSSKACTSGPQNVTPAATNAGDGLVDFRLLRQVLGVGIAAGDHERTFTEGT